MKKEFPGYFASGSADIESLWDKCLFVLDANVLLSLYRYSDSTRSDLLQVFESLGERLWVPNQVAYEYLSNRLVVIGEQVRAYDDAIKKTDALRKSLESVNQHPFVSVNALAECNQTFDKLLVELNANKLIHEKRISSDEIKDQLESLLEGRVGSEYSREKIEQAISDGKIRYEEKIPPGFNDAKKGGDSALLSERRKPYGDYIVWLQIIERSSEVGKPVVFVTGDVKDDWWVTFNGKNVGPLPQLIQEFLSCAGHAFYMYPPERFLERASTYLQREASQQAVKEIRDVREEEEAENLLVESTGIKSYSSDDVKNYYRFFWSNLEASKNDAFEINAKKLSVSELPWNASSSRREELAGERNSVIEIGGNLRKRLDEARSRHEYLQESLKRLSSHSNHSVREEAGVVARELDSNQMLISTLEAELAFLRVRMAEFNNKLNDSAESSGDE